MKQSAVEIRLVLPALTALGIASTAPPAAASPVEVIFDGDTPPTLVCVVSRPGTLGKAQGRLPSVSLKAGALARLAAPLDRSSTVWEKLERLSSRISRSPFKVLASEVTLATHFQRNFSTGEVVGNNSVTCAENPPPASGAYRVAVVAVVTKEKQGLVIIDDLILRNRTLTIHARGNEARDLDVQLLGGSYAPGGGDHSGDGFEVQLVPQVREHRLALPPGLFVGPGAGSYRMLPCDYRPDARPGSVQHGLSLGGPTPAGAVDPNTQFTQGVRYCERNGNVFAQIDYAVDDLHAIDLDLAPKAASAGEAVGLSGAWEGTYAPELLQMLPRTVYFSARLDSCINACPVARLDGVDFKCPTPEPHDSNQSGRGDDADDSRLVCSYSCTAGSSNLPRFPTSVSFTLPDGGPTWSAPLSRMHMEVTARVDPDRVQLQLWRTKRATNESGPVSQKAYETQQLGLITKEIKLRPPLAVRRVGYLLGLLQERRSIRRETRRADVELPAVVLRHDDGSSSEHDLDESNVRVPWVPAPGLSCKDQQTYTYSDGLRQYHTAELKVNVGYQAGIRYPHRLMKRFGLVIGIGGGFDVSTMHAPSGFYFDASTWQVNPHVRSDVAFSWWPDAPRLDHRLAVDFGVHWLVGPRKYYTTAFPAEFDAHVGVEQRSVWFDRLLFSVEPVVRLSRNVALDFGPNLGFGFTHYSRDRRIISGLQPALGGSIGLRGFGVPYGFLSASLRFLHEPTTRYTSNGFDEPVAHNSDGFTFLFDMALRFDITQIPILASAFGREIRRSERSH